MFVHESRRWASPECRKKFAQKDSLKCRLLVQNPHPRKSVGTWTILVSLMACLMSPWRWQNAPLPQVQLQFYIPHCQAAIHHCAEAICRPLPWSLASHQSYILRRHTHSCLLGQHWGWLPNTRKVEFAQPGCPGITTVTFVQSYHTKLLWGHLPLRPYISA